MLTIQRIKTILLKETKKKENEWCTLSSLNTATHHTGHQHKPIRSRSSQVFSEGGLCYLNAFTIHTDGDSSNSRVVTIVMAQCHDR